MEDWRTAEEIEAFNEGRAAYEEGYGDDCCPYLHRSDKGQSWLYGWDYEFEKHGRAAASDARDIQLLQRRS
jgi:ribosome modulation factor